MQERTSGSEPELDRFLYRVSHDLRSPVLVIQGFIGELRHSIRENNAHETEENLEHLSRATQRLGEMLNALLRLSRLSTEKQASQTMDLAVILAQACRKYGIVAQVIEGATMRGQENRILELFQEILDNAQKFSKPNQKSSIQVSLQDRGQQWLCEVIDDGIGIPPLQLSKIQEVFVKLNPKSEGMGIGLTVSQRIVEMHRGRLVIHSQGKDQGTTVQVFFPK